MKIGDSVFVHGYVDEIRKDCVFIRNKGGYFGTAPSEVIETINELPSAEAVQGEWIDYVGKDLGIEGQWLRDDGKTVFVQCDQCDSIFVRNLMTHMNFCPNCGARMTKGGDSE